MLRTTVLERRLKEKRGKIQVMKHLLDAYRRYLPSLAPLKEEKFNISIKIDEDHLEDGKNATKVS